jgi:hypothetical protein
MAGVAFLDASTLVAADPADGVHLVAADHGLLGAAIGRSIGELLR